MENLADQLKSLLYQIEHAEDALQEAEAVSYLSLWLQQRCEWRAIVQAERRKDIQTLERFATSAVNANIRRRALEFIQNVRAETLHTSRGGVRRDPDSEAANV